MEWISKTFATLYRQVRDSKLIHPQSGVSPQATFDVIIVGSGYGGSVMAARLAEHFAGADRNKRPRIALLERGQEFVPGEFPNDLGTLFEQVRIDNHNSDTPTGNADALFNVIRGRHVTAVVGQALGGGSQINASVAVRAKSQALAGWADDLAADPPSGLSYYARAERMLIPASGAAAGAQQRPLRTLPKDDAFKRVFGPTVEPAPLAVHFVDAAQSAPGLDVKARACNGCGNCVTGCNYGAKNTLTQTYLPRAWQLGVELYTRAAVEHFELVEDPAAAGGGSANATHPWLVSVYPAQFEKSRLTKYRTQLRTRLLILCAGAIGSTELLLRSTERGACPMLFSQQLGKRFSGNGDSLSFSFWERDKVNGAGWDSPDCPAAADIAASPAAAPAGPTISSMARMNRATPGAGRSPNAGTARGSAAHAQDIMVQNGVVPGAFAELVSEFTTTSAFTHDLTEKQWQANRRGRSDGDGAINYDEARTHTQTFLTMCDDGAPYTLALGKSASDNDPAPGPEDPGRSRLFRRAFIERPDFAPQFQEDSDTWLEQQIKGAASGADAAERILVSNPGYSPISSNLRKLLSGAQPGGGVVTVHPLGGCGMARHVDDGVVGLDGQVFRRMAPETVDPVTGKRIRSPREVPKVYQGLYVCDGSVFPRAIGVNPFLTIAALAERCSEGVASALAALGPFDRMAIDTMAPADRELGQNPQPVVPVYRRSHVPTRVRFNERLSAPLTPGGIYGARRGEPFDRAQLERLAPVFFGENSEFVAQVDRYLDAQYRLTKPALPIIDGQPGPAAAAEQHDFRGLSIPPALALEVSWTLTDVAKFLRGQRTLRVAESHPDGHTLAASMLLEFDESTVLPRTERVNQSEPLKAVEGEIGLFVPGRSGFWRQWSALWNWARLRGLKEAMHEIVNGLVYAQQSGAGGLGRALRDYIGVRLPLSWGYAGRAGAEHRFFYRFVFEGRDGQRYRFEGDKKVTFTASLNPWDAIGEIPDARLTPVNGGPPIWQGRIRFDVREFAKRLTPEVVSTPHLITGLQSIAHYGAFMFRMMLQHSLWHFRLPDYKPSILRKWEWPGEWRGLHREPFDVPVPAQLEADRKAGQWRFGEAQDTFIRLTRYTNPAYAGDDLTGSADVAASGGRTNSRSQGVILMYHGLLHSAVCFTTRHLRDRYNETIPVADLAIDAKDSQNMVEFFCARGYECWTVDMRVSTANEERKRKWTLDEVAHWDVPASIRFVNDHIRARGLPAENEPRVFVFAHCMGAAVFSMASLAGQVRPRSPAGELAPQAKSLLAAPAPLLPTGDAPVGYIDGLVLCQFGPFMVPSDSNLGRTAAVQLARDFLAIENYNPVEDGESTRERRPKSDREAMFDSPAAAALFDRLASSYPLEARERPSHKLAWLAPVPDQVICNRLALMIGENYVHDNLAHGSHLNLEEFIGPTRIETFWQTLYFGVKGRVVDYEGRNAYVTDFDQTEPDDGNGQRGFAHTFDFPILFLHGENNGLFHPRSTFIAMQHLRRIKALTAAPGVDVDRRYQYYKVNGYGHLENVLGKDAYRTVFPVLHTFFEQVEKGLIR